MGFCWDGHDKLVLAPARWLIVGSLLVVFAGVVSGHQDPRGDVYPEVRVANGMFSVVFKNNKGGRFWTPYRHRCVYDASGELVIPRHRYEGVGEEGGVVAVGGEATRRADGGLENRVTGSGEIWNIRSADGSVGQEALRFLGWELPTTESFDSFAILDGRLYLLGTRLHPEWPGGEEMQLSLYRIDPGSREPPDAVSLGNVATIYLIPTASSPVVSGGRLAIAWMGQPEGADEPQFSLTVLDPETMRASTRALDGEYQWNTSISMAAIGTRLCIAWHDGEIYGAYRESKIRVVFEDVEEE